MRPGISFLILAVAAEQLSCGVSLGQESGISGQAIYAKQCASCHGKQGDGTKSHPQPLAGERSVAQLTRLIQETMPEGQPGTLSGEEAKAVSAYVFDAYYSASAREKNAPPRIDLVRLTVPQFRNAVADIVAGFKGNVGWSTERGLKGEYFKSRNYRKEDLVLERVDPVIDFDWGTEPPGMGIDAKQFGVRHKGSIRPTVTGEYQFIVRTEHAARLFVNDTRTPLIDAWVKSGSDTEYTGSLFLVGGRIYPIRLEMSKAKQGVDDSNKKEQKAKPAAPAMLHLEWIPPKGTRQIVPDRCLSIHGSPEQLVISTPFPPDDRSLGWERGSSISKGWYQSVTQATLEAATWVGEHADDLAGTKADAGDRKKKLGNFCKQFAERAWRRPLEPVEEKFLIDTVFGMQADAQTGVQRVVLATLQSPAFLYQGAGKAESQSAVAERLAWTLWDSIPDQDLAKACAENRLKTEEQIRKQAERMLADPKGQAKLMGFFRHWLKLDQGADLSKDLKKFPGFDAGLVSSLRESLELQVHKVVFGPKADFRQLFSEETVLVDDRMAAFYGTALPAPSGFYAAFLNSGQRGGILTHPYLLAHLAYNEETSPIHRGVFIAKSLLGVGMKPPEAVAPIAPDLHPSLTTRERVLLQTQPSACTSCHAIVNPLGFALEGYDAVGRPRATDRGKPITTAGDYLARDGKTHTFSGPKELSNFLGQSPEAHDAFIKNLFHHLVQQPERAFGKTVPDDLRAVFQADQFDIRKLAITIASRTAAVNRDVAVKGPVEKGKAP